MLISPITWNTGPHCAKMESGGGAAIKGDQGTDRPAPNNHQVKPFLCFYFPFYVIVRDENENVLFVNLVNILSNLLLAVNFCVCIVVPSQFIFVTTKSL